MKQTTNSKNSTRKATRAAARKSAPPDGSAAALDAAAIPGAPDAIRAAVDALKAAEMPDDAAADDSETEYLDELRKEAESFEDRYNAPEVLHDYKVENWYDFCKTPELAFSGYDVEKIADNEYRSATEDAVRTLVCCFLKLNYNDSAALDLFAAAAHFSKAGQKELDDMLNDTRNDISERIRKNFSEALPPDVLERIIKEIHR